MRPATKCYPACMVWPYIRTSLLSQHSAEIVVRQSKCAYARLACSKGLQMTNSRPLPLSCAYNCTRLLSVHVQLAEQLAWSVKQLASEAKKSFRPRPVTCLQVACLLPRSRHCWQFIGCYHSIPACIQPRQFLFHGYPDPVDFAHNPEVRYKEE